MIHCRRAMKMHGAHTAVNRLLSRATMHSSPFSTSCSQEKGLFQLPALFQPQDFEVLTRQVKSKCHHICQQIERCPPSLKTLQLLDDLSNTICMVIDTAELCRHVHPNAAFRHASDTCVRDLSSFIQELNTNVSLYTTLTRVTNDATLMKSFTEEQQRMAILLQKEYERDGIHLPFPQQQHLKKLRHEIMHISMEFQEILQTARHFIQIPKQFVRHFPHAISTQCEKSIENDNMFYVPTDVHTYNTVLKCVGDSEIRKEMYFSAHSSAIANERVVYFLRTLQLLQEKRKELARQLHFESYAHWAMDDRMERSPEAVALFIKNLSAQLMPKAVQERRSLLHIKKQYEGESKRLFPWDVSFYMGILKAQTYHIDGRVLSSYFSFENCMKGLHVLCTELFGLVLSSIPMACTESWHSDVQKFALFRPANKSKREIIGYIYLDLFSRADKYTHAAHFTIRCGKKLSDEMYQKPIVALICNFHKSAPNAPTLLSHSEVETLFHEFGHALHSLLSRMEFQHLSGTRTQLDFVETPAHVLEYFAWDPRVVRAFTSHYATKEPIPKAMMQRLRDSKNMFSAMDTQTQCLYSLLDLTLFGRLPATNERPTIRQLAQELASKVTVFSHPEEMQNDWYLRFGHWIGYGAGYYSYLYARMFASSIWHTRFVEDPLSREAGKDLLENVLVHGGARDPVRMLRDLIQEDPMTDRYYLRELGVCKQEMD